MPEYTLLIVDDEPSIISSLQRLLRREGYTLHTAASGQEALELLETEHVDLILADGRMPGMSGIEMLKKVKARYPGVIRIILSGYTDVGELAGAINEGEVYRFILKPWNDEELKLALRHALEHRRLSDENRELYQRVREQNETLKQLNTNLEQAVEAKTRELVIRNSSLQLAQEILDRLPLAVIGVGIDGCVVQANRHAQERFLTSCGSVGARLDACLPDPIPETVRQAMATEKLAVSPWEHSGAECAVMCYPLYHEGSVRGVAVTIHELVMDHAR